MTRLELVSHLCQKLPALNLSPEQVYCMATCGSTGTICASRLAEQIGMHLRTAQRLMESMHAQDYLIYIAQVPTDRTRRYHYKLSDKGTAILAELLAR